MHTLSNLFQFKGSLFWFYKYLLYGTKHHLQLMLSKVCAILIRTMSSCKFNNKENSQ